MNAKYQFNSEKVYNTFNAEELLHRLNLGETVKGIPFNTYNELIVRLQKLSEFEDVYEKVYIENLADVRVLDESPFIIKSNACPKLFTEFGTTYFYDLSDVEYKHDFNSYPQANEN